MCVIVYICMCMHLHLGTLTIKRGVFSKLVWNFFFYFLKILHECCNEMDPGKF